jgi:hypothetical protein
MFSKLLVFTVITSLAVAFTVGWSLRNRRVVVRVLASLAGAVATACVVGVLAVGLLLAALFEPWPLGLRQGPDTTFSRACYAEFLGGLPPVDVTRVYCRKEWGFGGDSIYSIRFAFRATSTVQMIVKQRQLETVAEAERDKVRYLSGPGWWPHRTQLSQARDVYQRRGIEFLWVDSASMQAFYQQANF